MDNASVWKGISGIQKLGNVDSVFITNKNAYKNVLILHSKIKKIRSVKLFIIIPEI